jgi:hypothetical protein
MLWYANAQTAKEVDEITAKRIENVHGSHAEEHANMRKTVLFSLALLNPSPLNSELKKKALASSDKLARINDKINTIIEEGKKAKEDLL